MKTTARFEAAVNKLYTAYHANTLHPEYCQQCAVGTILDGADAWKHLSDHHGSLCLSPVCTVHQQLGKRFNGYTPSELQPLEAAFLRGCGYQLPIKHNHFSPTNRTDKAILFDGLCATVQLLSQLDGLQDAMDVSALLNSRSTISTPKSSKQTLRHGIK